MLKVWTLLLLLLLALAPATWAAPALENLPYRISLGGFEEVGRGNLSFKELGPCRYQAEFSGGGSGVWSLLSRWLPEGYHTEMIFRNGRLQPLVFQERLQIRGRRVVKEYRFDYQKGRLEHWRGTDGQPSTKRWQVPLKEPIYDPLSLFYNIRIGALGPLTAGETLRVQTIPTPDPEEILINLGPESAQGRKVMLTIREKSGRERGPYFLYVGPQGVPQTAWIRVLRFGRLSGELMDTGGIMPEEQLNLFKPQMTSRQELQ